MSRALNLARRPFRNERLPTVLLAFACVLLAAVTVRHAVAAWRLLPGRALDVEREAVALEREMESLRAEAETLGGAREPAPAVKEWAAVKELVDRRAFSWTALFADLEDALPPTVRLVSIAPQAEKGHLVLAMNAMGRDVDDALVLFAALQAHPHFRGAQLLGYEPTDAGLRISCRVGYEPGAGASGERAPAANAGPPGAAP